MGNKQGCCFRKDVNLTLEFNSAREDYNKKIKSKENIKRITKIQAAWKSGKLRLKLGNKLKNILTKYKETNPSFNLLEVRPGVRELGLSLKPPQLNSRVQEILNNIGPFMIEDKEKTILNSHKLFSKGYVLMENNVIYKGYWSLKGDREGYGELFYTDGSKFEGFFQNDIMNGRGRIVNIQGDYYEGELKNDKANGVGKYISAERVTYIGYWENDKQHGKGEEIYPDGSRFEGQFINGDKNGKGKFIWQDGSVYEGNFNKNAIHGKGMYRWKDGRMFKGDWVNNKMEGFGIFIWPDKKKYIGMYKEDKKSGYGIFYWPDGRKYEGSWFNGKQNGFGIMTINGLKRYGEWKIGKKIRWINENSEDFETNFGKYKQIFNQEFFKSLNSEANL